MGRRLRRARAPRLQAPRPERDRRHLRQHDQDGRLAERPERRLRLQRRRRRRRGHRRRRPPRPLLRRQHGLEPPVPQQGAHAVRGRHREGGRLDPHVGDRRLHGGHQRRRLPRHLRLRLRTRVVHAGPARQPALRQRRKGHFTERAARVRHRRLRLHHARRLPRLRRRRLPRPVRPQQLAQRLHPRRRGQPARRACPARRRTASTSSIGTTATATSPTCPSRPASSASRATDSASSSPTSMATAGPTSTSRTTSSPTTSSTSTTATGPSPTSAREWFRHASFAGMGVDIADFNNDGWPDVMQVDMMPHTLARRKRTMGYQTFASMSGARSRGYARRLLRQLAPAQQRRHDEGRPRLQRGRPHRRRRAHRLELERAVRRLRQRRPQGPLHRQRLSEGRERSRLHDHRVARPDPGRVRRLASRRHGDPQSAADLRGAELRLSQRGRSHASPTRPARGGWSGRASRTARRTPISTTMAASISS